MVTPQQLLLCGGREGPFWQNGNANLENWLEIEVHIESHGFLALPGWEVVKKTDEKSGIKHEDWTSRIELTSIESV